MSSVGRRGLPEVGIVLGLGSASVAAMLAAAARLVTPVFLLDRALPEAERMARLVPAGSEIIDLTGLDTAAAVERLAARSLKGLVTYSEYALTQASALARELGLPGHSANTVVALTEKHRQRERLREAGVHDCRTMLIPAGQRRFVGSVVLPAILKPVVGAGSLHTRLIRDEASLQAAIAAVPDGVDLVLEEYFEGAPEIAGRDFGDYVSVESLHCAGVSHQVCVTGKLPLTRTFRETGMFLPSSLAPEIEAEVLALEARAIRALGVTDGITHTEIKLTVAGPRLIEVNGRLGGYVPEILKRATGIDLVRAALQLSLGSMPTLPEPACSDVVYQLFLPPPDGTRGRLSRLDGLEQIEAMEGVSLVERRTAPGEWVDTAVGTQSLVGIVYGRSRDLGSFRKRVAEITETLIMDFSS
jgi:hypothetical protein